MEYAPSGAFANRRLATWQDATGPISSHYSHHGFTGHEHLDELNLVHMNGRIYDPVLGRFLSADPNIQAPLNTQSLNRYSYVLNNPLSYTDPTGYFFYSAFKKFMNRYGRAIVFTAIMTAAAASQQWYIIAAMGYATGYAASGGNVQAGLTNAAMSLVFWWIGGNVPGKYQPLAYATAGAISAKIQGQNAAKGFMASFIAGTLSDEFYGAVGVTDSAAWDQRIYNMMVTAVIGGSIAELGGGKFANGAVTSAFSRLLKDLATSPTQPQPYDYDAQSSIFSDEYEPIQIAGRKSSGIGKLPEKGSKGVTRSLDDVDSLRGAKPEEIEKLIPDNWVSSPLKKGEGTKYLNPNKKGEAIMIEKGWPDHPDLLHRGPYVRISRDGQVTRIPLEGNPILK